MTTGKQDNTQQDNLAIIIACITHTHTPRKTICHLVNYTSYFKGLLLTLLLRAINQTPFKANT